MQEGYAYANWIYDIKDFKSTSGYMSSHSIQHFCDKNPPRKHVS
jgi:hypothetical protein